MSEESSQVTDARLLKKSFSDIINGFGVGLLNEERVFVKHLTHIEQAEIESQAFFFQKEGERIGLPTEKRRLEILKGEGSWTEEDDKKIELLKEAIENLEKSKAVISKAESLKRQNDSIAARRSELAFKQMERDRLIGITAESYSSRQFTELYIKESLFKDRKFEIPLFTDDSFDALTEREYMDVVSLYNGVMETVGDKSMKRIAIQPFFSMYWNASQNNLYYFYGKPVCDLTSLQINLCVYGNIFKDILKEIDSYPKEIRNDPDKLLDYVNVKENSMKKINNANTTKGDNLDGAVATSIVGGTKEDYEAAGVGELKGESISLSRALEENKKKGKRGLDMHDIMGIVGFGKR